jgi:hypothetical protein
VGAITLYTSHVADGTQVPYTITGVDEDDLDFPTSLTGYFTVNNDQASILVVPSEDVTTEGSEIMTLTLDGVGTAVTVQFLDTSLGSPTPTPSSTPATTPSTTPTPTPSSTTPDPSPS